MNSIMGGLKLVWGVLEQYTMNWKMILSGRPELGFGGIHCEFRG